MVIRGINYLSLFSGQALAYNKNSIQYPRLTTKGWRRMKYQDIPCLIAYFSHAGQNYTTGGILKDLPIGNTERVADMIREYTGGTLHHIWTAKPYPEHDYHAVVALAKQEKAENARPRLEQLLDTIVPYDVIFLGYPNWCGTMPMAVWTFLESFDFSGKIIRPFCTHEGSGFGHSLQDIKTLCPQAKLEPGLALLGTTVSDADDDVRRWLADA